MPPGPRPRPARGSTPGYTPTPSGLPSSRANAASRGATCPGRPGDNRYHPGTHAFGRRAKRSFTKFQFTTWNHASTYLARTFRYFR